MIVYSVTFIVMADRTDAYLQRGVVAALHCFMRSSPGIARLKRVATDIYGYKAVRFQSQMDL